MFQILFVPKLFMKLDEKFVGWMKIEHFFMSHFFSIEMKHFGIIDFF